MTRTIWTVVLLIATFVVVRSESHGSNDGSGSVSYGSASASANAFASVGSVASSSANVGNFPGFVGDHDSHKGIRSYDESGYASNKRENSRVQVGRGNNGCPKCKWEDDDYWEKDEEEVEEEIEKGRSDTECYDDDDGQYREPDHGHGHGSKGGTPLGVQKLGSATPVGQRPSYAGVANAPTSAGTPVKAAISPWNKMSPASIGSAYQPGRSTNPQPGSGWNSPDSGTTPIRKPSWNSKPEVGSQSSYNWNAGPPSLLNAAAPKQFDASWRKGPETGSGCPGCVQGSRDAAPAKRGPLRFAGDVRKQGSPDPFPNPTSGPHPTTSRVACSGDIYGNCGEHSTGRIGSGFEQYSGSRSPEYNPVGQFPGSGSGASSGPQTRNPLAFGSFTTPYPTTNPSNRVGANANAASTGTAYAEGFPRGSPTSAPLSGNFGSYESVKEPGYTNVKGTPLGGGLPTTNTYAGKPFHGDNKPGTDSGRYPTFSGTTRGLPSTVSSPGRGVSDKGDSKIFYINVSPAPGSPVGVKPRGMGTANVAYQPQTDSGTSTAKPSYQPRTHGGGDTTKPSYQFGPYSGTGTTKSSYQPGTPGGGDASKSSYQPNHPSGSSGWPDSATNNAHPSTTGNISGGCGSGTNRNGSPDYKACDRNVLPEGVDKSSGPLGGPDSSPNDFFQSSQSVFNRDSGRPWNGGPPAGFGCAGSTGCMHVVANPTYVDKTKNANAHPGGGGSYQWNPFLTGKLPSPDAGGPRETTTSKPIGYGNPFLEGLRQPGNVAAAAVAGAGAWSQAGASIGKEPIGKGNLFLVSPGHSRGDIEIDGSTGTTPGRLDGLGAGGSWPIRTMSGTPSLEDKAERGAGGEPSGHNPGANWDAHSAFNAGSSAAKNPPATNRGSGSGGGIGFGYDGHGNFADQPEHGNGDSLSSGSGFTGAFSGSQASSYASSNSGSHHNSTDPAAALGQGNTGSWPSNGASAGSQAGSGYWASSGATAYASSSASSWAGTGPISVKG